jgi:8-oxo-dGTP pyrophosphatase MutT (NUDIX family)
MAGFDDALRAGIARNLDALAAPPPQDHALRHAAVCLIVTPDDAGRASLVLTLRPSSMRRHANQFAFPGGRVDADERPLDAALRETQEEIGLTLAPESIIGRLDDYPTRSGFLITPFVAWVPDTSGMQPDPAEVAKIYRVPFEDVIRDGSPEFVSIPESDRPVIRYPLLGTHIHAPTAALIYQFTEVAVLGRSTRVAHLEQPVWAWR